MSLIKIKQLVLFLIILLFTGACSLETNKNFNNSYYKSEKEWLPYLKEMEFDKSTIHDQVLLILRTTECMPCVQELNWWNKKGKEMMTNVAMVMLERHETVFDVYLESENIQIPAYQDSSSSILKNDLVPTTPIKLYFNNEGDITVIDHMGAHGDIQGFLNEIENSKSISEIEN